jgi:tetratricopeptide (TPR) repeat protein
MAKKLAKEEVEQDLFTRSFSKVQAFYLNNRKIIMASGAVVLLAIGLAIGYHYYEKSQNKKAAKKMAMAEEYLMRGNYKLALTGSAQNFTVGFQQIINNYSNTRAGNLARYYAAVSEFHLGNTQKALSYINKYKAPDGILGVAPLSFKAMLYTQAGKYTKGAQTYVKAAEWDVNNSTTPYNYLEAARAYHAAGQPDKAKKYVQLIINDYSNSSQSNDAKKLLGILSDHSHPSTSSG